MTDEAVLFTCEDKVAVITLNRPKKFNCLSSEILDGLDSALDQIAMRADVRAILIRANGDNFCTGADLQEVKTARNSRDALEAFIGRGHRVLQRFETVPQPVVGAVQGLALAGGLEIVLVCDVVFAGARAKIGDQHAQFGLVPGFGGTQRLPRLVGGRRANDLMFSARWLSAQEAQSWGLVNYVVDDDSLRAEAEVYCHTLATRNPEGLAAMKALSREADATSLQAGLQREREAMVDILRTENVAEGLTAFEARRTPEFNDAGGR